jgi:hypothetical protein
MKVKVARARSTFHFKVIDANYSVAQFEDND